MLLTSIVWCKSSNIGLSVSLSLPFPLNITIFVANTVTPGSNHIRPTSKLTKPLNYIKNNICIQFWPFASSIFVLQWRKKYYYFNSISFRVLSDCSTSRWSHFSYTRTGNTRSVDDRLAGRLPFPLKLSMPKSYADSVFKTIDSAHLVLWALESPSEPHALRSSGYAGGRLFLRIMSGSPNCRVF